MSLRQKYKDVNTVDDVQKTITCLWDKLMEDFSSLKRKPEFLAHVNSTLGIFEPHLHDDIDSTSSLKSNCLLVALAVFAHGKIPTLVVFEGYTGAFERDICLGEGPKSITIGDDACNDINVRGPSIARSHARLYFDQNSMQIICRNC
jgi:hypothetical protein